MYTNWDEKWIILAHERFSGISQNRDDWRKTEAMAVPDGVILMTTVVTIGSSGSSSSINTMFVPRVKIEGRKLVAA